MTLNAEGSHPAAESQTFPACQEDFSPITQQAGGTRSSGFPSKNSKYEESELIRSDGGRLPGKVIFVTERCDARFSPVDGIPQVNPDEPENTHPDFYCMFLMVPTLK